MSTVQPPAEKHTEPTDETPRRGILIQFITAVISVVLVAIPSALSGLFFLDPILRKRKAAPDGSLDAESANKDDAGFIRLTVTREAVPQDGTPVAVTVRDDIVDAWNLIRDVPRGSVWLRRIGDGPVVAFNSICPHLGCSVNFRRAENDFFCPCHTSAFALDGSKTNKVPPRDMDALEVAMRTGGRDDPDGAEIWVRYRNFRKGTAEKTAI